MSIEEMAHDITRNSRPSFTFLDMLYKDKAVDDELLIDKKTGKIYYKNKDGVIVSSSESAPINTISMLELGSTMNKSEYDFIYPTSKDAVMIMMSHLLSNDQSLIDNIAVLNDFTFDISTETNGFFANFISRLSDINIIEVLTSLYYKKHGGNANTNTELTYDIIYTDVDNNSITKNKKYNVKLNTCNLVPIDKLEEVPELTNIVRIAIVLKELHSDVFTEMINDELYTASDLNKFINEDGNICLSSFQVNDFTSNLDLLPNDPSTIINNIYDTNTIKEDISNTGGSSKVITSELQIINDKLDTLPKITNDLDTGDKSSILFYIEEVVTEETDE